MKQFTNEHRGKAPEYQEGQKVLLDATNLRTIRPSKKLDLCRLGPFCISKVISPSVVKLELPKSWKIHPVFNVSLIHPYQDESTLHPPIPEPPPPEILDDELEYEVEEVLDSRRNHRRKGSLEYLVHWKGYPSEDDSWVPVDDMKHSQRLVKEFHKHHPQAIQSLTMIPIPACDSDTFAHCGRCALRGG